MAHTVPTAAEFKAKYPTVFDAVADATVDAYISDASTEAVDQSWPEAYYKPAIMAFAAHQMFLLNIGAHSETDKYAARGVTQIKTGEFSASFDQTRARASMNGELSGSMYGVSYERLLHKVKGGPRVFKPASVTTP